MTKINLGNFKTIMNLREDFAKNRQTERIEVIDKSFKGSSNLSGLKHKNKLQVMSMEDHYKGKHHKRNLELQSKRK